MAKLEVVTKAQTTPASSIAASDVLLFTLGRIICSEISTTELLRRVVDVLTECLGADRGTLYMLDESRGELVSVAAHLPELATIRVPLSQGVAGHVASTGEVICIDSCATDSRFWSRVDEKTGYVTRSMLAAPVRGSGGRLLGVAQVLNKRVGVFTEKDTDTIAMLADQVGLLLEETTITTGMGQTNLPSLTSAGRPVQLVGDDGADDGGLEVGFNRIVGRGTRMQRVFRDIRSAAPTEAVALIVGDAGTGKSLVAKALHHNSRRADGPFIAVDCAAQSENLIETELFGVERESWPNGRVARSGHCEEAARGTLYLAEVGALSFSAQNRLLQLLDKRTFHRVSGQDPVSCDVRVVASTRRNLQDLMAEGRFREDLFYKLRGVRIDLPPLSRRGLRDLRMLVDHFLVVAARRLRRLTPRVHADAMRMLQAHHWPGNVRELENCIEAAVVLCEDVVLPEHLLLPTAGQSDGESDAKSDIFTMEPTLSELEARYIGCLLERYGGNRTLVARKLGVGRNTLLRKIKHYGIG
jgi:Nif-specific regulatory protein